jgi:PPOX class probable F420-dependent enzyme
MGIEIPETHRDLLERPIVSIIATANAAGNVHTAAVWRYFDGTYIKIETGRLAKKTQNIRENPQVSVISVDPDNAYRYIEVRGVVEAMPSEGALEHLNKMAFDYLGHEKFYGNVAPAEEEADFDGVLLKIRLTHVTIYG